MKVSFKSNSKLSKARWGQMKSSHTSVQDNHLCKLCKKWSKCTAHSNHPYKRHTRKIRKAATVSGAQMTSEIKVKVRWPHMSPKCARLSSYLLISRWSNRRGQFCRRVFCQKASSRFHKAIKTISQVVTLTLILCTVRDTTDGLIHSWRIAWR